MPNYTSTVTMQFRADTTQAKKEMIGLQRQFKDLLSSTNLSSGINKGITSELKEAQKAAATLQLALQRATNADTGSFDLREFDKTIKRSGQSLSQLGSQISRLGSSGALAFSDLTEQIVKAEQPLRQTSKMLDSAFKTMANSVKWQLSATAVYGIMDSISGAYQYAVDLDSSLNDIRIVSGQSAEQMAAFAEYANQAAKSLSTTTVDYSNAALIYYQQGLAEQEVKERTDLTIQMANVTGDTVQEVSDQLTAVWNNFYDGSHSLEYYTDVMTELGAATASSSSEIAEGLQDFSAIADMIGLSFDYAATAIATTTSVSRQSANVVGTSFRSIFARIQGLMMGETLEDGVDLNKYSEALAKVGINVLDATGNLRDMNSILDEMGQKWSTLSQTQQTALAQTVAGVWQYNNLVTLMNNWDTFQQNLDIAQNSAGSLQEQSEIFEESWRAAANRVKANLEDIYNSILDGDVFKDLLDGLATFLNLMDTVIDTSGGLPGVLAMIGAIGTKVFKDQLANGIKFAGESLFSLSDASRQYYDDLRKEAIGEVFRQVQGEYPTMGNKALEQVLNNRLKVQQKYNDNLEHINEFERQHIELLMQTSEIWDQKLLEAAEKQDKIQALYETTAGKVRETVWEEIATNPNNFSRAERENDYGLFESITKIQPEDVKNNLQDFQKQVQEFVSTQDEEVANKLSSDIENSFKKLRFSDDIRQQYEQIFTELDGDLNNQQKKLQAILDQTTKTGQLTTQYQYNALADQVENIINKYEISPDNVKGLRTLTTCLREMGDAATQVDQKMVESNHQTAALLEIVGGSGPDAMDRFSSAIVGFGNALANSTIAVLSLNSAWNVLNDEEATFFEKVTTSLLALGMAIPAVVEGLQALNTLRKLDIPTTLAQVSALLAKIAATKAETAAMTEAEIAQKKKTKATSADIAVTNASAGSTAVKEVTEGASELGPWSIMGKNLKEIGSSILQVFKSAISVVKMFWKQIAFVIIAVYTLKEAWDWFSAKVLRDQDAYNLEQTTSAVQNLTQEYNNAKTAQEELLSQTEGYKTARDNIDSLTRGTQEYTQAIIEANDQALELIKNNPESIGANDWSVGKDGLIEIDVGALEEANKKAMMDTIKAQAATSMMTQRQNDLSRQNEINELGIAEQDLYAKALQDPTITLTKESIAEAMGLKADSALVDSLYKNRESIDKLTTQVEQDKQSREATSESLAKQILSANGFNDDEISANIGNTYNKLYEETYDSVVQGLEDGWDLLFLGNREEVVSDIMRRAGFSEDEIESAKYDEKDQELTYDKVNDNGEIETVTISDDQLAGLVAANESVEDLIDSAGLLADQMNKLNASTEQTDQSIASFLQNGSLEDLTQYEFNAVKNMSKAEQKAALGLTGDKEHDDAMAIAAGYDDAKAYFNAFEEALEVEWKVPEGISDQLAEALSIGGMEKINENYSKMGEDAGKVFVNSLNEWFNLIDFSNFGDNAQSVKEDFVNAISTIDWSDPMTGVRTLRNEFQKFNIDLDTNSESFQNFLNNISSIISVQPNIEELRKSFQSVSEITSDLEIGDILSKEDYQALVNYNSELSNFFTILSDGSAMLTGDLLDIQRIIHETNIQNLFDAANIYYAQAKNQTYDLSESASNQNRDAQGNILKGKELASMQSQWAQAQIELLRNTEDYNKENEKQLNLWEQTIEKGNGTKEIYDSISNAVKSTGENYIFATEQGEKFLQQAEQAVFEAGMQLTDRELDDLQDRVSSGEEKNINQEQLNAIYVARNNQERWEDIDTEEVQKYSEYLMDAAESSDILSDSLSENVDAADEVALATIRTNNGMEELIKGFENWNDILQNSSKESEEYAEALSGITSALSDVLGVTEDSIDGQWVADNLGLIQQAAEGSDEAIAQLRRSLSQDIFLRVMGVSDFSQLDSDIQQLYNQIMNSDALNVEVGAVVDDQDFINVLNSLIDATGMTTDTVQGMFDAVGFHTEFEEDEPATVTRQVPQTTTHTDYRLNWSDFTIPFPEVLGGDLTFRLPKWDRIETATTDYVETSEEIPQYSMYTKEGSGNGGGGNAGGSSTKVSAHVKSLTRTSSPSWSGSNFSTSKNPGGSPAYSPSGSGGGGGGGGSSDKGSEDEPTPAELMDYTQITEVVDRYYEIIDSLEDMTDALDDAADAADRLYGKDRIAAMERQRDLMAQQQKLLKQYRSEIEAYLAKDKAALENNEYGIHFTFDADGDITNYTQIMTDLWNQVHAAEQTYNSFATKEEQDAYQESTLDPLNKKIEEIKNLVDTYDSTQDLLVEVDNQIRDALNEWQDKNYEILTYKIELQIEINDMEQERLDYYLNKYEDDFYKMAESMALTGDSFPLLTNNLETYKNEMNQLSQAYHNGEISQDAFIEGMKEVNSGLLDNMNALIDLDREMLEYYENTLDSAEDKFGDFTDQLEHQMSILEHYQNVLSLIGKEQDYQMIGSVLQGQFSVAQDQLAAQERWVETLKNQMADIQSDLLSAVDEKEREALNEQLLLVTQRLNEAEESVNDLRESVLELAQSILENDLAKYAQQLSENLVEGLGFGNLDEYLDTIDKLNTSQEEYLTTTNKVYETNKLIRQAQEDMAENDSLLAKQRYQEYIDYVEQLQEQGRLSEYELKIAQARYEVLQAQIALEEAQNAKDSMRLVRDSQGNYNYVYTANQDNISQAQQALEDAENNLYNIGLEGAQNYQDKYAQILEEAFNAFKDLSEQYKNGEITSEEEFNQKRLELQNYYYNRLKDIQDLYYIAHDLLVNESYTNEADYLFAGIGNLEDFKDATDQYLQDCNNAFDEWQENTEVATDSVGNGMGDLQDHIQDVTDTSSDLTDQIQDSLIPALEDELEAVRDMTNLWLSHRDALYETLQAYEELQQGAQNTISNAAGVQPGGVLPNIPEEYQADIGAIMAAYLQQGGNINDDLFQQLWNKRNEKVEWLAANGYSSSYWGSYGEETIKGFEELVSGGGDQDWYDYAANMYTIEQIRQFLQQMGLPTFKSGGYTGSWGPSGKLAIIHEKELILNQDDTNSLVNIIRDYGKLKSTNSMDILNLSFNDIITKFKSIINKINLNNQNQVAAQQVSIEASFPNVSVASEIEDAFNDLLNRAAQYASLNRTNY